MKHLMIKCSASWSKYPVFVSGVVLGAVVALSSPGFSAGKDGAKNAFTATLYAIAELAVATEINAGKVVALEERVRNLEDLLEEISGDKE